MKTDGASEIIHGTTPSIFHHRIDSKETDSQKFVACHFPSVEILRDVVNADASHIFLGRPWQFDVNNLILSSRKRQLIHVHAKRIQNHQVSFNRSRRRLKECTTGREPIFSIAQTKKEFMSEMKEAKGVYVLVVRSLAIEKTEEREKPKIVIPEKVWPLLAEFSELVSNDPPIVFHR